MKSSQRSTRSRSPRYSGMSAASGVSFREMIAVYWLHHSTLSRKISNNQVVHSNYPHASSKHAGGYEGVTTKEVRLSVLSIFYWRSTTCFHRPGGSHVRAGVELITPRSFWPPTQVRLEHFVLWPIQHPALSNAVLLLWKTYTPRLIVSCVLRCHSDTLFHRFRSVSFRSLGITPTSLTVPPPPPSWPSADTRNEARSTLPGRGYFVVGFPFPACRSAATKQCFTRYLYLFLYFRSAADILASVLYRRLETGSPSQGPQLQKIVGERVAACDQNDINGCKYWAAIEAPPGK